MSRDLALKSDLPLHTFEEFIALCMDLKWNWDLIRQQTVNMSWRNISLYCERLIKDSTVMACTPQPPPLNDLVLFQSSLQRKVLLDVETTGLSPSNGDRIIEVCAFEMYGDVLTGRYFYQRINPERAIPWRSQVIHGISAEDLKDSPPFRDVAKDLRSFLNQDPLIIHNAAFDSRFLNSEFQQCDLAQIPTGNLVDTLKIARKKLKLRNNKLSDLALFFKLDMDRGVVRLHSAFWDVILLYQIYIHLIIADEGLRALLIKAIPWELLQAFK